MKHVVCTLDIDYSKSVTDITLPAMKKYSDNIGAEFLLLTERKFPHLPLTQEKFQLHEVEADHITFLDVDALINPNAPDFSVVAPNAIVIAEILDGADFIEDSIPGREQFRVHSAFLSFSSQNKFIVKPHDDPMQYIDQILNKNPEWQLDEFVMTLNVLKNGADLIDLKRQFPDTIAHDGNYKTIEQKVEFLKRNQAILRQRELLYYG
jgi:hypothetical protein